MLEYIMACIALVVSITFLRGKGSFLIAGYNTADKKEKQQYKVKRVTRVMGIGMGVIALLLFLQAFMGPKLEPMIFISAIIVDVVAMLVLVNTYGKIKPGEEADDLSSLPDKPEGSKLVKVMGYVVGIGVAVIAGVLLFTGQVKVEVSDEILVLSASYWNDYVIEREDIKEVTYRETFNHGGKKLGIGNVVISGGTFTNEELGDYVSYVYVQNESAIVIETEKTVVVVNCKTADETKALYEKIK